MNVGGCKFVHDEVKVQMWENLKNLQANLLKKIRIKGYRWRKLQKKKVSRG